MPHIISLLILLLFLLLSLVSAAGSVDPLGQNHLLAGGITADLEEQSVSFGTLRFFFFPEQGSIGEIILQVVQPFNHF